jgi:putative acetyltransferase
MRSDGVEIAEYDNESSFRSYRERNPGLRLCARGNGVLIGSTLCGHDGLRGLISHLAAALIF